MLSTAVNSRRAYAPATSWPAGRALATLQHCSIDPNLSPYSLRTHLSVDRIPTGASGATRRTSPPIRGAEIRSVGAGCPCPRHCRWHRAVARATRCHRIVADGRTPLPTASPQGLPHSTLLPDGSREGSPECGAGWRAYSRTAVVGRRSTVWRRCGGSWALYGRWRLMLRAVWWCGCWRAGGVLGCAVKHAWRVI